MEYRGRGSILIHQNNTNQFFPCLPVFVMLQVHADTEQILLDLEDSLRIFSHVSIEDVGRPNRLLALDRFLDSKCQSRLSHAWWRSIFSEKGFIQARQLRPIGVF